MPLSGSITSRLGRAVQYALVACWGLALLANVQGWSVAGSDWLASGGSSFWTRCGSAMCACGAQAWDDPGEHVAAAISECCSAAAETTRRPGPVREPRAGGGGPGLKFVAFGSHRRQNPDGTPTPEISMIPLPQAASFVDVLGLCGRSPAPDASEPGARSLDAPTPPPRSC